MLVTSHDEFPEIVVHVDQIDIDHESSGSRRRFRYFCYNLVRRQKNLFGVTLGARKVGESPMEMPIVVVDPEIQSGAPVFSGTRVPIQNLFDYLEEGDALDVFLEQFPTVTREMAIAVLEQARVAVTADAHLA